MRLEQYIVNDIIIPFDMDKLQEALRDAEQVIMKFGYPHGKDAEECLVIYALYLR